MGSHREWSDIHWNCRVKECKIVILAIYIFRFFLPVYSLQNGRIAKRFNSYYIATEAGTGGAL